MKKELSKVRESRVLFEPPEPLFGGFLPRRRIMPRVLLFCIVLGLAIGLWVLGASGAEDGHEDGSRPYGNTEAPAEQESEKITERGTEAEKNTEGETGELNAGKTESETDGTDATETAPTVKELDMSEAERGDDHVLSYVDKLPDISGLIDRGFLGEETTDSETPVIMVIHTHTSEEYIKNNTAPFNGVVSVGDILSTRLNLLGLNTVHCTVIHDGSNKNAYIKARETIKTMLKIYPSIKYIIDLHRMEIEAEGQTVKTVSGEKDGSAQIRLTVSADSGKDWQESLSLALSLRQKLNRDGARVCMPTVISQSRYNSDLSRYYIMADIGSSGNTVGEAKAAAVRLAEALADVLLQK